MSLSSLSIVRMRFVTVSLAVVCIASSLYGETISGTIRSGGTSSSVPLRNVNVALFEASTGTPNRLAQVKSDSRGHFKITSSKDSTESIFFLSAQVDVGVQFIAVLGPSLPSTVTMNELTTVAASYSMAQFYRTGVISGDSFGLRIAAEMNDNLVDVRTGVSSQVLLSSPNADGDQLLTDDAHAGQPSGGLRKFARRYHRVAVPDRAAGRFTSTGHCRSPGKPCA